MPAFFQSYVSALAAILTIIGSLVASSSWLRKYWERHFLAKPRDKVVNRAFTFHDVQAGMAYLENEVQRYAPEVLVGINRGGAIVGGILGKHLGLLVHVIEVRRDQPDADFEKGEEYLEGKRVLVIDDRLASGSNMDKAYTFVRRHAGEVRSVVFACLNAPARHRAPDWFAYSVATREIPLPWEPGAAREWH